MCFKHVFRRPPSFSDQQNCVLYFLGFTMMASAITNHHQLKALFAFLNPHTTLKKKTSQNKSAKKKKHHLKKMRVSDHHLKELLLLFPLAGQLYVWRSVVRVKKACSFNFGCKPGVISTFSNLICGGLPSDTQSYQRVLKICATQGGANTHVRTHVRTTREQCSRTWSRCEQCSHHVLVPN